MKFADTFVTQLYGYMNEYHKVFFDVLCHRKHVVSIDYKYKFVSA